MGARERFSVENPRTLLLTIFIIFIIIIIIIIIIIGLGLGLGLPPLFHVVANALITGIVGRGEIVSENSQRHVTRHVILSRDASRFASLPRRLGKSGRPALRVGSPPDSHGGGKTTTDRRSAA